MPAKTCGSVFKAGDGYGIRWPEDGRRPQKTGFRTKTRPATGSPRTSRRRLSRGPAPDITFDEFCDLYLQRHAANVRATIVTPRERLAAPREVFGAWQLRDLEGAADDLAGWRPRPAPRTPAGGDPRDAAVLGAAVRWRY